MCDYSDYVYERGIERGREEAKAEVEKAREEAVKAKAEVEKAKAEVEKAAGIKDKLYSAIRTQKGVLPLATVAAMFDMSKEEIQRIWDSES